jgi:formylglycine-generating enzyme required for sulfatase activity
MCKAAVLKTSLITMVAVMISASGSEKTQEYQGEGPKIEFVRIPAGSFQMGSPDSEKDRILFDSPIREVQITEPFYMGKYEITQAQWEAVMGTTVRRQRNKADSPWRLKGEGPEYPMYYVSWEEANEFCKRLGNEFRLPTEAEWEYACRAGSQTRFYYGEDPDYSELDQYAWYYGKSDNKTHPVGQTKPNAWGLHDMHGNVYEWCSDRYETWSYVNAGSVDPTGPRSPKELDRTCRGGSWLGKPDGCRSASRAGLTKSDRLDLIGFRVVFTGKVRGDSKVLEIALPEKAPTVATTWDQESGIGAQTIAGVLRDEAGMPIGDVDMWITPRQGWIWREYSEGSFEISWDPEDPNTRKQRYHLIAL